MTDAWTLTYEGADPASEGLREALCTLGNGYMATRGAAPESAAGEVHYPGTYVAGLYNRLSSEVDGHEVENESLVNVPSWLPVTFRVDDGPWFSMAEVDVLSHRLVLDLARGVLTRATRFRDVEGRTTTLTQRRFVHMGLPHLAALETTLGAEDWAGTVTVRAGVDGTVRNTGVARYRRLADRHLDPFRTQEVAGDTVLLVATTTQSHVRVAVAARTRVHRDGARVEAARRFVQEPGWVGHDLTVDLAVGERATVEKVVTLYTSRDRAISDPAVEATDWLTRVDGFDGLLTGHAQAWARLWRRFCLEMPGDPEALRVLRLHVFHVLATVSPNTVDLDVGVPARGWHGEAYRGHVLWDELFVFPLLTLRLPELSRSLLLYRYRRLPWARRLAADAGYAGAMYPWQSGSDGREENQTLHLNPLSGRWVPDVTHRQRHIGAAVAYNVWQYYQATADHEFLTDYGAEVLLDVARFWSSLATYDAARDRYVIRGVVGPDEFHTAYAGAETPGIDNNAYTNVMAVWVLRRARQALGLLSEPRRTELRERLGLDDDELARWEVLTRRMFVPFHDGVLSQFEGYEALAEFDWEAARARYGAIHRLDRLLEAEGDDPNRYKLSKQADVLMLFYLLSADELGSLLAGLGYAVDHETIPRTVEYYLARTSHGSTLSAVVHAWVLARAHREEALAYFQHALASDVNDIQGGTTAEGVHLAAMAGSVDLVQRCFSGLETRGDTLWLSPYWPESLPPLEFTLDYRGHPLTLRLSGERVQVTAGVGMTTAVRVGCHGEVVALHPGETVEFPPAGSPQLAQSSSRSADDG
jgi:trehalose/maltose hydrolase-like predicted phosphorylase